MNWNDGMAKGKSMYLMSVDLHNCERGWIFSTCIQQMKVGEGCCTVQVKNYEFCTLTSWNEKLYKSENKHYEHSRRERSSPPSAPPPAVPLNDSLRLHNHQRYIRQLCDTKWLEECKVRNRREMQISAQYFSHEIILSEMDSTNLSKVNDVTS